MQLSIHYYVLLLSERTSRLYEGLRDTLFDIQNTGFPFEALPDGDETVKQPFKADTLSEFLRKTDRHFAHYFAQDPLRLVVIGERKCLSIFESVTVHREALIGEVEGDYSATSSRDLGRIVWPVVKQALAGAKDRVIHELEEAASMKKIISGFDAVGRSVESDAVSSLFVEEDYHVKGSIRKTEDALVLSPQADVREVFDDAVDVIIEKVLEMGGTVSFLKSGALMTFERIALILRD